MKVYKYDSESKIYVGEVNCQIDPIATQRTGEPVYLLPANCTFIAPLQRDGFYTVWNGVQWEYVEIPQPEPAPEPTPEEQKEMRIAELKAQLDGTDYKIIKCSEYQLAGIELPYDVVELHTQRQALRDEINQLEKGVENADTQN